MFRPIKFRIFHKEWNEMFYSMNYEGNQPKREWIPFEFPIGFSHYKPDCLSELMQFIGLNDKNSNQIYEGDILKFTDILNQQSFIGCVSFQDASFVIKSEFVTHYRWQDYTTEIIGNVHQNPELLKLNENEN